MGIGQWISLVVFVVCLYISWQIRQVLLLIFTAVVIATALSRLVRLFQRFRIGRGIAIFLSVGLLLLLLAGFSMVVVPPFLEQLQELVKISPEGLERLRSWTDWLQNLIPEQVVQDFRNNDETQTASALSRHFAAYSNAADITLDRPKREAILQTPDPRAAM